jgi:hypothetical protein
MYSYKAPLIIGLACTAASALTVPNVLPPELWFTHSTDHAPKTINTLESLGRASDLAQVHDTKYHSYNPSYGFRPVDGWESVPVSNLSYKYSNATNVRSDQKRRQRSGTKRGVKVDVNADIIDGTVGHAVGEAWNELKGIGKAQGVTITWSVVLNMILVVYSK